MKSCLIILYKANLSNRVITCTHSVVNSFDMEVITPVITTPIS